MQTVAALFPLEVDGAPGGFEFFDLFPVFAVFALLGVAAVVMFLLWRHRRLDLPRLWRASSPEQQARVILAERFARGDITVEEFMERASILNWTPGSDTLQ